MNRETQALMGLLQNPDSSNVDLARALYVNQDVDRPFFERIFAFIDKEFKRDKDGRIIEWGKLNLSKRQLTTIPDETQYFYLIELSCEDNQLTTLGEYPKLTYLYCWNNKLTTLPEYPNLTQLYCWNNKLKTLPEYPKLTILACWKNQLTEETKERFRKRGLL
jgi:hypothetical protein